MSHTLIGADRLVIKTAAGQDGIGGNDDGHMKGNAPDHEAGTELEVGRVVVTRYQP